MLETYTKELNKREFDDFAKEYYGINLDSRSNRKTMDELFFAIIETEDKSPLKQLPFEELLVEDNVVESLKADDNEITSAEVLDEIIINESIIDSTVILSEDQLEEGETIEDEPVKEIDIEFKPSFELNFKNGPDLYSVVSYTVTDFLESMKNGIDISEALDRDLPSINTVMHYITKFGKVMLRETRNSRFITYTKKDFE